MSGTYPPSGGQGQPPYGQGQPNQGQQGQPGQYGQQGQPGQYGQQGQPGQYGQQGQPGQYGQPGSAPSASSVPPQQPQYGGQQYGGQQYGGQQQGQQGYGQQAGSASSASIPPQQPGQYGTGYGTTGYGSGGYGAGPTGPNGPSKGMPKKVIYGIIAGILGLALIAAIIIGVVVTRDPKTPGGDGTPEPPKVELASDAVKAYLDALAAGDAETALSFAETTPADATMLTNEVLAASNKLGAISAITVPEVTSETAYAVAANYKIGTRTINAEIPVSKVGDTWKLAEVTGEISQGLDEGTPILINGVKVDSETVPVFPGVYAFATGSKYVGFDKDKLTIDTPGTYESGPYKLELNSSGTEAALKAAKGSMNICLKKKSLTPEGCGFAVRARDNQKVDTKSIKWSATEKDPFKKAYIRFDDDLSDIQVRPEGLVKFSARGTQSGSPAEFSYSQGMPEASVDLTGDKPRVSWG